MIGNGGNGFLQRAVCGTAITVLVVAVVALFVGVEYPVAAASGVASDWFVLLILAVTELSAELTGRNAVLATEGLGEMTLMRVADVQSQVSQWSIGLLE